MSAPDLPAGIRVFARLSDEQRRALAAAAREREFPAGTRLFSAGDEARACWVLLDGRVALTATVPSRGEVVVQTVEPPDLVGWSWLLPPFRWRWSAVTVGPVRALELDAASLRELAERDPALGHRLLLDVVEMLGDRLHATRARVLDLYGNPRDR